MATVIDVIAEPFRSFNERCGKFNLAERPSESLYRCNMCDFATYRVTEARDHARSWNGHALDNGPRKG